MSVFYIATGTNHFILLEFYKKIMPPWLPFHTTLIVISGIVEVLLGLLLLFPRTRMLAARGIIGLLIAVFPANIQMLLNYSKDDNPFLWVAPLRLPLQLLLIAWAYSFIKSTHQESRKALNC